MLQQLRREMRAWHCLFAVLLPVLVACDVAELPNGYYVHYPNSEDISIADATALIILGPKVVRYGVSGDVVIGQIRDPNTDVATDYFFILDTTSGNVFTFDGEQEWRTALTTEFGIQADRVSMAWKH